MPNRTTDDVLFTIHNLMEDAKENNKELWIILQDMKRAFDSVDPAALALSLRRLNIPESYIKLHEYINANRTLKVSTAYGLTPSFHPESGLPQGGVECPLHWLIFYDPLLCYIQQHHKGYTIDYKPTNTHRQHQQLIPISIPCVAFVDDSTFLEESKEAAEAIIKDTTWWYSFMAVEVNGTKSKLIILNSSLQHHENQLLIAGKIVKESPPTQGERLLGIHISSDMKFTTQRSIITEFTDQFIKVLARKQITDQMTIYLINNVLLPAIIYRYKLIQPTEAELLTTVTSKTRTLLKNKAQLPKNITNTILHLPSLYNLNDTFTIIRGNKLSTYANILESNSSIKQIQMHREAQLADQKARAEFIFTHPLGDRPDKQNYCSYMHWLQSTTDTIYFTLGTESTLTPLATILPKKIFLHHQTDIAKSNIFYLEQLLTNDKSQFITYAQMIEAHGTIPKCFLEIVKAGNHPEFKYSKGSQSPIRQEHIKSPNTPNPFNTTMPPRPITIPKTQPSRLNKKTTPFRNEVEHAIKNHYYTNHTKKIARHDELIGFNLNKHIRPTENDIPIKIINESLDMQELQLTAANAITIYTDGSITGINTHNAKGGCGIIMFETTSWSRHSQTFTGSPDNIKEVIKFIKKRDIHHAPASPHIAFRGHTDGVLSSFKTELMAIYQALKYIKPFPETKIHIKSDSLASINIITKELTKPSHSSKRHNQNEYIIISAICKLIKSRPNWPHQVVLEWIRGHASDLGNIVADQLAGLHESPRSNKFDLPKGTETTMTITPRTNKVYIETNLRTFSNKQQNTHIGFELLQHPTNAIEFINPFSPNQSNTNQDILLPLPYVNIKSTVQILMANIKISSPYTTLKASQLRSQNMKKLFNILPTLSVMKQRNTLLYPSSNCIQCETQTPETNEHLWECPSTESTRTDIFKEALTHITKPINKILLQFKIHNTTQIISTIQQAFKIFPAFGNNNTPAERAQFILSYIPKVTPEEIQNDINTCKKITQHRLFQGLVFQIIEQMTLGSLHFAATLSYHNQEAYSRLTTMISKQCHISLTSSMIQFINSAGIKQIWKPRCNAVIEWEKTQNITTADKRIFIQDPNAQPPRKTRRVHPLKKRSAEENHKAVNEYFSACYTSTTPQDPITYPQGQVSMKKKKLNPLDNS